MGLVDGEINIPPIRVVCDSSCSIAPYLCAAKVFVEQQLCLSAQQQRPQEHGRRVQHTHCGVLYVRFGSKANTPLSRHFSSMAHGMQHYDSLHFKRGFRGGSTDEILVSFAFAAANPTWRPLPFRPLLSFVHKKCEQGEGPCGYGRHLPSHLVHVFDQSAWIHIASDVLGRAVTLATRNVKSHSVGRLVVHTCGSI